MRYNTDTVVGIIGDGQLALMLAEALQRRGIKFCCLSTSDTSSMARSFPDQTTQNKLLFQSSSTTFTLENEFLSMVEIHNLLKEKSCQLFPDIKSYSHFVDKISQRILFEELGLPSPKWRPLQEEQDLKDLKNQFSYPYILKASQGGYDGKGVREVENEKDLFLALKDFGFNQGRPLLVEEKVRLKKEVAQGFIRNNVGDHTFLPLVDTVQKNGVCNLVYYPAEVSESVKSQIHSILKTLVDYPLIGIFNFEFFIDQEDHVTINEGAPRPHNSQHLTMNASNYSQFDLLAMYLAQYSELPGALETLPSAMINILGKSNSSDYHLSLPALSSDLKVFPKLYAKELCLPGRKMGHVNIVAQSNNDELKQAAERILMEYKI
jgi:phosphoribosylaminoimidazole carboxylase PurK protein